MPGPQQKRPFWSQTLEDVLPPVNTDKTLGTGQQTWVEQGLGIEKDSPLDTPSLGEMLRGTGRAAVGAGQAVKEGFDYLKSAPQPPGRFEPEFPSGGVQGMPGNAPSFQVAPPPPLPALKPGESRNLGGGKFEVPSTYGGTTIGTASFNGPKLNTEAALAGLKGASSQFNTPRISTEELYKQAYAKPQHIQRNAGTFAGDQYLQQDEEFDVDTTAPGASEWATQQLKERQAPIDFQRLLGQKQQETMADAQTSLHPAVRASRGEEASRQALPAQITGRSNYLAALLGAKGRQYTGDAAVESARARRDGQLMSALTTQLGRLSVPTTVENAQERSRREAIVEELRGRLDKAGRGEVFLSDYFSDADADEIISSVLGDDSLLDEDIQ